MTAMRWCFFTVFFYYLVAVQAQNLVPNPSFEEFIKLPQKHYNGLGCLKYWRPHNGNCDYYHKQAGWWTGTPRNIFGRQKPHSGNAYAGICVRTTFKEYIEVKITAPLVQGQTYQIELYVSEAERFTGHIEAVGIYFKENSCWSNDNNALTEIPAHTFKLNRSDRPQKNWIHLSAEYIAEGFEKAVLIGYYQDPSSPPHKGYSHLYIDDVSITPLHQLGMKPDAPTETEWARMDQLCQAKKHLQQL